jgi:HEAT repeat protein
MTSNRRSLDHQTDPVDPALSTESDATRISAKLVRSLDDPDWRVRQAAAVTLGDCGDPRVTALVLQAMRTEHQNLRVLNGSILALARNGLDVVTPLTGFLDDPDPQLRIAATLTLGERQDPRAIPALMKALEDSDVNVRFHAIEALGKLRAGEAVDALVAIAGSGQFELAAPALDALGAIGDCRVSGELLPLLDDQLLQLSTLEALGRLGDEETVKVLVGLVNSSDDLRAGAARALVGIWQRFERSYRRGDLIIDVVTSTISAQGIQSLLEVLESSPGASAGDLSACLDVLGWVPDPRVDAVLIRFLEKPLARKIAIEAIARRGTHMAELAAGCLAAPDPETKSAALEILGRTGDPSYVDEMLAAAKFDSELALVAISSLAKIGESNALAAIASFLGESEAAVRQAAIAAVKTMKAAIVAKALPQLLAADNPDVREAAIRIAADSKAIPADLLLAFCTEKNDGEKNDTVRCAAFEALGEAGDLRVLPHLMTALETTDAALRTAAMQALAGLDSPQVAPLLRNAASDSDSWVRYFAVRGLGARRDVEGIDLLLRIAEFDGATQVRVAAIDALGVLKADRAVGLLIRLAAAADPDLKHAALLALGPLPHSEIFPVLVAAASAEELSTRLAGIHALGSSTPGSSTNSLAIEKLRQIAIADPDGTAMRAAIDALKHSPLQAACEALLSLTAFPRCREDCVIALSGCDGAGCDGAGLDGAGLDGTGLDGTGLDGLARGLMKHESVDVRRSVVEALSRHADQRRLQHLQVALHDPMLAVRHAAAKALAVLMAPHSRETGA